MGHTSIASGILRAKEVPTLRPGRVQCERLPLYLTECVWRSNASNTSNVVTFHHSNGIHDQGEISGVPLRERQQDELPIPLLGFSPEDGLPEWETDLGGVPARVQQVPGLTTLLRPRRCGAVFCLGNPGSCATLGLQLAYTDKERTLSATPGLPRIGGPLSTARSLSTVLQAPLPPRVRAVVRPSPTADHVLAVGGHLFTVGNWSLPMWRFHSNHRHELML